MRRNVTRIRPLEAHSRPKYIPVQRGQLAPEYPITSSLPRFDSSWVPLYIPRSTKKNDPTRDDISVETNTDSIDAVASEKKAPNLPINSKVEIYFDNDQANRREQELMKLQPLAAIVKNNPAVNIYHSRLC